VHLRGGDCVLCTVYCVLCTVHCVLCTVYCVLCTVYCVLLVRTWEQVQQETKRDWSKPLFVLCGCTHRRGMQEHPGEEEVAPARKKWRNTLHTIRNSYPNDQCPIRSTASKSRT
jgi:hypothetical protein